MKKRITALALAVAMVLGTVALAAGTEKAITVTPMTLTINGQTVTPAKSDGTPAEMFAYDGVTYVPLRYLSELLGVQVEWDKNDPNTAKLVSDEITLPAAGGDGTYTGTASGFGGTITATITVVGGKITACTLVGDKETPAIGGAALSTLEAQVVAAGGADIDGVSGATMTSNSVKDAVAAALTQAAGVSTTAKMKPGTYQASAFGFSLVEKVPVTVTVTEDKITGITISEECSDTTIILRNVQELLVPRILESQSVAVDTVTGATSTSGAVKAAVTDCLKQALVAGGSSESAISAFQTPVAKANVGKQETKEGYDVIVVGVGGAGTMAAASAAEQGLKVMAVEKAGKIGGTSVVTSAPMAINPTKFQAEFNEGKDYMDKAEMRTEWLKYTTDKNGVQKAKADVVDVMLDYSGETLDWLVYDHDFVFSTPGKGMTAADKYLCVYNYVGGREVISNDRRTGAQAMYDSLMKEYKDKGNELMLETEATEIIMENGQAVGVKAVNLVDGTEYTIRGKAVVLCTGGFAGNNDMVDQYVSQNEFYDFSTPGGWKLYGMHQNDGKMIASAIANGAATYNISMPPMVHNTATRNLVRDFPVTPADGTNTLSGRPNTQSINDIPQIMSQVGNILVVGNEGKRIVDESKMGQLGSWINGREFYAIWSSTQIDNVKENGFKYVTLSRYLGQGGVTKETAMPQIYEVLDASVKANTAYTADTLEELAAMIGVPAKNLVETVAKYNKACQTGVDAEFGKGADYLDAIGEGPYYCVVGAPYCYSTCGGLDVDKNLNVLNTKGQPIKGLYACGEDSLGCMMSDDKAYVTYGGAAQGWALTSGYYVGKVLGKELGK